jgi:disulfide bond formation protein DsbB
MCGTVHRASCPRLLASLRSGAAARGHPRLGVRAGIKDVDGRDEPGRRGGESFSAQVITPLWIDRQVRPRYAKIRKMQNMATVERYVKLARAEPKAAAAGAVAVIGLATIFGFLFFEHVLGYPPCPLCFEQRYAYYFAVPLAAMILLGISVDSSRKVLMLALLAIAAAMIWNAGLGAYHAGVEWRWWAGPQDCSGPLGDLGSGGGVLQRLQSIRIVRCDEAPWRFLGLSLAGYNVLISAALAAIAVWGALAKPTGAQGSSSVSQ